MNQSERRQFLLRELLAEEPEYRSLAVPADAAGQKQLLHPGRCRCGDPGTAVTKRKTVCLQTLLSGKTEGPAAGRFFVF